jgi:hypothetical protein
MWGRLPTESVDGVHSRGRWRLHYNRTIQLVSLSGQSSTRSLYELILRTVYRRMARVS